MGGRILPIKRPCPRSTGERPRQAEPRRDGRDAARLERFDHDIDLEKLSLHSSKYATHVRYRVSRGTGS